MSPPAGLHVGVLLEQCLSPVPGGTGRYSRELVGALARTAGDGDRVTGWTAWHRQLGPATVPGVAGPRRLPLPRRALVAAWDRGLPPGVPVDLCHAPTPLAPARRGRPLVVTVHDAVPWTHPGTLTPRGAAWHRRAVARAARDADLIVVPTQAVAHQLAEHVALREVLVVGEGVSADLVVPPDAAARRAALRLPDRYLLSVATLEPRKGLDVLLDALALPQAPDLPLLVAGQPGWGGVDLDAEAAARGLPADRVRALGRVSDADLAVLLANAVALVAPSRAEGFGLPVLEAMAAGTPVVTSADPALVEVGGGAAVVAGPGPDGLAAALVQVQAAEVSGRLSAAGRVRARAFDWDQSARRLWQAYRALTATARW